MTTHLVVFCSRSGWHLSSSFLGDKRELTGFRAGVSCEKNWEVIARRFSACKTLEEFREVNAWAQSLYHDERQTDRQENAVSPYEPQRARANDVLYVYEDLAVTGLVKDFLCDCCSRPYQMKFLPDGTVTRPVTNCFSCGRRLSGVEAAPAEAAWKEALAVAAAVPGSYRLSLRAGTVASPAAKDYEGRPVKVTKIVSYDKGEFFFEVLFRDWTTMLVGRKNLEELPAEDAR